MKELYKTYILPVKQQELARKLSRESGRIYSKVVSKVFDIYKRKGFWLNEFDMKKYIRLYAKNIGLHSQTKQGIVEQYYIALDSFFKAYKNHRNPKPPYKRRKYNVVMYKDSAIKLKNGILKLSNGKGNEPLMVKANKLGKKPKYAELVYHHNKRKYFLHITVEMKGVQRVYEKDRAIAVDLGQIHPMVTYDSKRSIIFNGGVLNSFIRFRNKQLGKLQQKMSICKKYSKRWKKLNGAKKKLLNKSKNKVNDVLQKYTSYLVGYCIEQGIGTIVIGDIKGIRENINYGVKTNQKLHNNWLFRKMTNIIEYKANSVGIKVEYINEAYTSQTCPVCSKKHKPGNRNFRCKCGFKYHRDAVGAINIYKKYTSSLSARLEGDLTPPVGYRYRYNQRCLAGWNTSIFDAGYFSDLPAKKVA